MPDRDVDAAISEAAALLARSTLPVITGHLADAAAASAAFRLARKIGGVVDHAAAAASLRDHAVLAQTGSMLISPGEARQRADVFLIVGDGPLKAWPDLLDFLLANGFSPLSEERPKRIVVAVGATEPRPQHHVDVVWRRTDPAKIPALLGALRARIAGRPVAASTDVEDVDRLAALLKGAKFGVAAWWAGELDAIAIEMATGLVKDLNAETRWSAISAAEDDGAAAAAIVAGWTTGFPLRTGFARGDPEHDPWRFDTRRMVESSEADAAVWIAAPGQAVPPWLDHIPMVEISTDSGAPGSRRRIGIRVGIPGIDHDAIVHDRRTATLVRRAASAPSGLPAPAAVLDRITALLP